MSYRNNQRFNRTDNQRLNQYQPSQARFVTGPQTYQQQQPVGNIRFTGNLNANNNISSSAATSRVQGTITQPQNVYNSLQSAQVSASTGGTPWGSGMVVPAGQQTLQHPPMPPGFQNPTMSSMANPQQNQANMMGLLANQQLLAQAAGLVATPGLGLQVPFAGSGILGAAPIRGQLSQVYQNVGQTGMGPNVNYSPKSSSNNQRNSRSSNQQQGHQSHDNRMDNKGKQSFDRSSDSRDHHGQNTGNRDRNRWDDNKDGRRDDRKDVRKDERKSERSNDRKDSRKSDQRDIKTDNRRDDRNIDRNMDARKVNRRDDRKDDRRDDRKNVQRNDRTIDRNIDRNIDRKDDRKDNRRDDKHNVRKDDRKVDVKREDKSGDKRKQPIDRKGNSDSDSSKRGSRGDNRNKDDRDRSRDRKSTGNQGNRSHRDGDNSDNIASSDQKRSKGKDNVKSTSTSSAKKSRTDDQEIETDGNDTYDDILEEEIPAWLRCSPSDLYFTRDSTMFKETTLVYACIGGRDLHVGLDCDEFHLVPGAIVSQLTVEALQRASQIAGHKTVYFIAGIPDFLTTLTSPGYEETIFEDRNLFDTFYGQMRQTDMALKVHNCHVIFSTISSMSLKEYNENNKRIGKTYTLRFEKNYSEMQENLHRLLMQINISITNINTQQKLLTPFIHSHVNKKSSEKNKVVNRLSKFLDGLNPCGTIVDGWRNTMNKTILRNKVMMSKPDFLMKM